MTAKHTRQEKKVVKKRERGESRTLRMGGSLSAPEQKHGVYNSIDAQVKIKQGIGEAMVNINYLHTRIT